MTWKKVKINLQNVQATTEKAYLIACPHKSRYDGYCFWHPAKLVRGGNHSYALQLSFTDEFVFTLKKYGQGKWNKSKVLHSIELSAEEFEKIYN